jgi:two-component system chemotaxis response regulator CheY
MKRCLVVDDSRVIRRVASKIIQDLGLDVEEAENGKKAMNAVAIRMPDLVFTDWDMPVMTGIEFVRELRRLPGGDKVAVVFCTTENEVPHILQALEAGADEYIMKPFDGEIVRSKLLLLGLLGG